MPADCVRHFNFKFSAEYFSTIKPNYTIIEHYRFSFYCNLEIRRHD